jgi:serine/threonine protein kinase
MLEDWKNETTLKLVMDKIGVTYKVLEYLGGGGLSKIYKIRHKGLDQIQILKIMDFNHILNIFEKKKVENIKRAFERIKKRFIIEAKIYRKFRHPNIVEIFDIGFVKNQTGKIDIPYLIMEYIQGQTLKEILREKSSLEVKTVFKISADVLSALDTIHQQGIIHRDIKPSNIMIRGKKQEVVILDFGLAKDVENTLGITDTHTAMGTLSYTSPEMLADSKTASLETDIYSFGIVLYEMITGELPFKGSYPEVLLGHLNPDVSIPEKLFPKNPKFYREINRIIKKAMAKEIKDRYRSAGEFLNDLKRLNQDLGEDKIVYKRKIKKESKLKEDLNKAPGDRREPGDVILGNVREKLGNIYDFSSVKLVGYGTYSKIYRLRHRDLEEDHALKISDIAIIFRNIDIPGTKEEFERIKERFEKKIQFFRKFKGHPNILNYVDNGYIPFEYGELPWDIPYMLSKYIEGHNLEKLIKEKKGGLPPAQIFNISEKILKAIVRIHEEGFYYWVVLPRKIIIRQREKDPVLIYAALPENPSMETDKTRGNAIINRELLNTMLYFKNEKITQKQLEIASVISTFGLLLYEMVTGDEEIRSSSNSIENLAGKLNGPAIELKKPLLPHGLLDITARTLEKDPLKRYRSVNEFLDAIKVLKKKFLGVGEHNG